jgi:hypothetical protein
MSRRREPSIVDAVCACPMRGNTIHHTADCDVVLEHAADRRAATARVTRNSRGEDSPRVTA